MGLAIKYVLNQCHGGYGLSRAAVEWINANGGEADLPLKGWDSSYSYSEDRSNPVLVACVEALGAAANGQNAKLVIVDVTISIEIDDFDGYEDGVKVSCSTSYL